MSKMVTARELAERTGYSVRFFQDMAGRCEWAMPSREKPFFIRCDCIAPPIVKSREPMYVLR